MMHDIRQHLTLERKNIANLITLGRFCLNPVIIILFFAKKAGKGASLHLVTSKAGGIAFIAFIASFYLYGFNAALGLITVLLLIADHLEQTAVYLIAGKDTDRNWRSVIEAVRYTHMR